jgi:hypothetical protein
MIGGIRIPDEQAYDTADNWIPLLNSQKYQKTHSTPLLFGPPGSRFVNNIIIDVDPDPSRFFEDYEDYEVFFDYTRHLPVL